MSDNVYDTLSETLRDQGPAAAIDQLIQIERDQKQYHRLFDALLMKKKFELGLPVTRPTTFEDVPEPQRKEFEERYVAAAREVGQLLIDNDDLPQAWLYFRTIGEPAPVRDALANAQNRWGDHPKYDEILNIALYEGANPLVGVQLMLQSHGTCNTVTSLDQMMPELKPDLRSEIAGLMVKHLYGELQRSLQYAVQQRIPVLPPNSTIRQLCTGRDWLFADSNYHIDVSHLNAVVRFARSLDSKSPDLPLAIELAEYGAKLDPKLQYDGDAPFQDFYTAHAHYLKYLAGQDTDAAWSYFEQQLEREPDEPDKQMIAYVMVDLLMRTNRLEPAVELAEKYLADIEDARGFSFAELCRRAGKSDVLEATARERRDPLRFAAALISAAQAAATP